MHACLVCFSVFKSEIISQIPQEPVGALIGEVERPLGIPCPTMDCIGQVIKLDELILPAIFSLNYKGYITRKCSSGHIHSRISETYVTFGANVELPDLPHGFAVDELKQAGGSEEPVANCVTIRKRHDSGDRIGSILLTNKKLYDWTRGLPNLTEAYAERWTEIDRRQNELLIMRMLAMGISPLNQNIPPLIKKKAKQGPA